MNDSNAKKRLIYGAIASALILAGAVLLFLQGGRKAPVFAEFSPSEALDGSAPCYFNALDVLDRFAEEPDKAQPSQLLLVRYYDRDETEVLVSLLVEQQEGLYETLSGYFNDGDATIELKTLSGYFLCEPLKTYNRSAVSLFEADAAAYLAWSGTEQAYANPVVLRFAGETEEIFETTVRRENRGTWITVGVMALLALACGVRILTLRAKKTD